MDPSNPNPNPNPSQNSSSQPQLEMASAFRGANHRRAHSEVHIRIPDDLDLVSDPFLEDDLFCSYMDIEKFGSGLEGTGPSAPKPDERPRHRHSNSVDEPWMLESIEAKKAIAPEKLAELWTADPKRAKRLGFCSGFGYEYKICEL